MTTRVIRVTVDGRTTTVRATDPGRVLNVGPSGGGGGGVSDHGALTGLTDDDHTQYLTNARGDARYDALGDADAAQSAAEATAAAALTTHAADTTSVHGITDTSALETTTGSQAKVDTHSADTTAVHGITDTSALVLTGDARLTDARTPTAHATSHQDGGTDELALDGSQITTGTVADARIASTIARDSEVAAAYQPLDSDLTAIATLSTTAYGRSLLEAANAAGLRTLAGLVLGTDVYSKSAVDSGFQPLDSDLTAIAALTTTATGRSLLAGADAAALRTILALGNSATRDVGTSSAQVAQGDHTHAGGSAIGQNLIQNGRFRTNQRAYVSAASLASGAYGFDRWKATTASTTLTYTSAPQGQAVTINSGGSIAQVVERAEVPAGDYVLSWEGTATGRVYNVGASAPAYAASPVTVTLDGTANVTVEFQASGATKTLDKVKLESGSSATTYTQPSVTAELRDCQRFYHRMVNWTGSGDSTTTIGLNYEFPVRMRAAPTAAVIAGATLNWRNTGSDATDTSFSIAASGLDTTGCWLLFGGLSGITGSRPYSARMNPPDAVVEFTADL